MGRFSFCSFVCAALAALLFGCGSQAQPDPPPTFVLDDVAVARNTDGRIAVTARVGLTAGVQKSPVCMRVEWLSIPSSGSTVITEARERCFDEAGPGAATTITSSSTTHAKGEMVALAVRYGSTSIGSAHGSQPMEVP